MTCALPASLIRVPLAHRALHDTSAGRPENSRAAIRAAIAQGYGLELDLQLSSDGDAMVFHDYDLARLTGMRGAVRLTPTNVLQQTALLGGDGEGIPTLSEVLGLVAGQVPLLIELKDQDAAMGPEVGPLEAATAASLQGYSGDVAVMSFNPYAVSAFARHAPNVAIGLTTSAYAPNDWSLSAATCDHLRQIPDFDAVGAQFISHEFEDLDRPRVKELRARGVPVLTWTIKSQEQEAEARQFCDNVTFEGYAAALAG